MKNTVIKAQMKVSFKLIFLLIPASLFAQPGFPDPGLQDETGFIEIFDGKSLAGWDGDPVYWRVEDGVLTGEITPETIVDKNTFIIWRGDTPSDFELKCEYRISPLGNSGINYRSVEVPDLKWVLKGYQSDIDGKGRWTGMNYEERGRTFLALRGQVTRVVKGEKPKVIGEVGDRNELLRFVKNEDWNECHLIVRHNLMIHMVNGQVMSVVIDDDEENRMFKGLIGVQVHVGPPMKVEYRNIRIKNL